MGRVIFMSRLFDSSQRPRYLDKAQDFVLDNFAIPAVARDWERVFRDLGRAKLTVPLGEPNKPGERVGNSVADGLVSAILPVRVGRCVGCGGRWL
jgi:hypothetical protein